MAAQCITIFGVVPASAVGLALPSGLIFLLLLVFMSITIVMARGRWTIVAGTATLILATITAGTQQRYPSLAAELGSDVISVLAFAVLSIVVFKAAFGPGRFTGHRIRGAVVLYLNIGMLFAVLHRVLAQLIPGAYAHLPNPQAAPAFRAAMDYFSFTTLTSLGFGDIVPVNPLARSLSTLESAMGQLYPPTLLARVVMLELAGRDDR